MKCLYFRHPEKLSVTHKMTTRPMSAWEVYSTGPTHVLFIEERKRSHWSLPCCEERASREQDKETVKE